MKNFILSFLFFLYLSFNINIVPCTAQTPRVVKAGIYTVEDLRLKPDTMYTVENNSFSDRTILTVFDSTLNVIQTMRLIPQSGKFNLTPLKPEYKIVIIGDGSLTIS